MKRKQSIDELDFIKNRVQKSSGHCSLASFGLDSKHMSLVVELLNQKPVIKRLVLTNNNIGSLGAEELTKLMHIEDLDISHNDIGDKGAAFLLKSKRFKKLNLSNNIIISYETLADGISINPDLDLKAERVGIGKQKEQEIADILNQRKQISNNAMSLDPQSQGSVTVPNKNLQGGTSTQNFFKPEPPPAFDGKYSANNPVASTTHKAK